MSTWAKISYGPQLNRYICFLRLLLFFFFQLASDANIGDPIPLLVRIFNQSKYSIWFHIILWPPSVLSDLYERRGLCIPFNHQSTDTVKHLTNSYYKNWLISLSLYPFGKDGYSISLRLFQSKLSITWISLSQWVAKERLLFHTNDFCKCCTAESVNF